MSSLGKSLSQWYREHVRRLLETVSPKRVEGADLECARLEGIEASFTDEVHVCFLGASGVGKSTLINALVGEDLLPHGGIGPLTAQALSVRFGVQASFQVWYHSPAKLVQLAFALEKTYLAGLRRSEGTAVRQSGEDLLDVVEDQQEIAEIVNSGLDDAEQAEKNKEYRKQAALMIGGRQDAARDTPYLIDRLREVFGKTPAYQTVCLDEDFFRIERLRAGMLLGKAATPFRCLDSEREFKTFLHEHATGFLAPIISKLDVSWNAPVLKNGIVLVDLPGVGIAGDVHAKVTEEYIKQKAKVVVLVVTVRGVTEPDADMLRSSGFLSRLLHSSDDPEADPVQLMMAVVKADDIAETRYAADRSRPKREHFAEVCSEATRDREEELRRHIEAAWKIDDKLTQTKEKVLNDLIAKLNVHTLSAVQYRRLLANDEDDQPFIKDLEESNVPAFSRKLAEMTTQLNQQRLERLERAKRLFFSSLENSLRVISEQWKDGSRAESEAEALRKELEVCLEPIRKEFNTRQGAFRAFLRETVPSEIEKLVLEASMSAQTSIRYYLRGLRDAHWGTLRAAVRRGGTFYGARHISLPDDFALRYEEPIAEIWGKKLLQVIRKRTKAYAHDCIALVEQILTWAKGQGARFKITLLEAQRDQIKTDAQQLTAIGEELIDEFRREVRDQLISAIRNPIRTKCEKFVKRGDDIGAGVKGRILELFDNLSEETVGAAKGPAGQLLTARFRVVEKEIGKILRSEHDPITDAAEAIVESHEDVIRRSDAKRRNAILKDLTQAAVACPAPWLVTLEKSEAA